MWKGTKLYSVFKGKCPRCHEGQFFESHVFDFKKLGNVLEQCDRCNMRYRKEPGFFQGSYYVAYALGVALFVTNWLAMFLFFPELSADNQFLIIAAQLILFSPVLFMASKIIWANIFIKYRKDALEKH